MKRTFLLCITPATGVVQRYEKVPGVGRPVALQQAVVDRPNGLGEIVSELDTFRRTGQQ